VEGLNASDFEVTENGVQQRIALCEFQEGFYVLGYFPRNSTADGSFRKLNVTVKTATAANVEYREGYFMPAPAESSPAASVQAGVTPPPYDRPPVLIFKMEPEYSEAARKAKYQRTVLLYVEISETGQPLNMRVSRSLGLGLDEKA